MLKTKRGKDLPENSVKLTEAEALSYQKEYIRSWPSGTDVAFLNYGNLMSSMVTFFSSHTIMSFLKAEFKLSFSPFICFAYIANISFPCMCSYWFTEKYLTNNILLQKMDCPLCKKLNFSLSHFYVSLIYPSVLGYLSLASHGMIQGTFYTPNVGIHSKEFWKTALNIFQKNSKTFRLIGPINIFWILFLPLMQEQQMHNVMNAEVINEEFSEFDESEHDLY